MARREETSCLLGDSDDVTSYCGNQGGAHPSQISDQLLDLIPLPLLLLEPILHPFEGGKVQLDVDEVHAGNAWNVHIPILLDAIEIVLFVDRGNVQML